MSVEEWRWPWDEGAGRRGCAEREGGALMCSCGEGKVMAWNENVYEVGSGASMEMLGGGEGERKGIRKRLGWRRREEEQRRRRS